MPVMAINTQKDITATSKNPTNPKPTPTQWLVWEGFLDCCFRSFFKVCFLVIYNQIDFVITVRWCLSVIIQSCLFSPYIKKKKNQKKTFSRQGISPWAWHNCSSCCTACQLYMKQSANLHPVPSEGWHPCQRVHKPTGAPECVTGISLDHCSQASMWIVL